jgi:DNA mismatch repair protein MutL
MKQIAKSIQLLPPEVTRMIAAGEVISRPLDVVRELLDNALDALATRIEIELTKAGLERITVKDNGAGIPFEQVEMAPQRHATSKLYTLEGVGHLEHLGFRGEALWSMAMAGTLELITRPQSQLGAAKLTARGPETLVQRVSAPAGTRVSVLNLFGDLPARREMQASKAAEYREITQMLGRYVLHYPHLNWKLTCDGDVRLQHAPSEVRGAVITVYGTLVGNRLLSVPTSVSLSGVISRPELSRPQRDRMHLSVNGRPVQFPPELERAVLAGYAELLPVGHAPVCVLELTLPPERINPNIHPNKSQVAMSGMSELAALFEETVRQVLAEHPLSRAAPALREIVPEGQLEGDTDSQPRSSFPNMRPLGVYRELYLVAEGEGDLWLIDGHAAHERILYERFERAFASAASHPLEQPEMLNLTPEAYARLLEREEELASWGFVLEGFGGNLIRIRALPQVLTGLPLPNLLELLLEGALSDRDPRRAVLSSLACAPALKAGEIRLEVFAELLSGLAQCAQPWSCPHGRPTVLRLSERDLAHAFGRRSPRDVAKGRDLVEPVTERMTEKGK